MNLFEKKSIICHGYTFLIEFLMTNSKILEEKKRLKIFISVFFLVQPTDLYGAKTGISIKNILNNLKKNGTYIILSFSVKLKLTI